MTDGLLVVDKPAGWTSHDVVARVRRLAGTRKVGHAGTLDPMATGVLLLGLGRATRLLGHLALADKGYAATIRLGATTTTDDAEGELLEQCDASGVTGASLREAVGRLTGPLQQVPSSVSAVKVAGRRAYARVRDGEQVELAPRAVVVSRFDVLERRGTDVDVAVDCSSGTYVRALARDLGADLGVGAHLCALRRTRVGEFGLGAAATLDELAAAGVQERLVPLDRAVAEGFPCRQLAAGEAVELSHGRPVAASGRPGVIGALAEDGTCVALLRDDGDLARTVVVFAPAGQDAR